MNSIPRVFAATALLATAAVPAVAQDHPMVAPTRDVVIDYLIEGRSATNGGPQTVRMSVTAGGHKTLVEPSDGRTQIIIDRPAGRTYILMMDQRKYMERPLNQNQQGSFDIGHGNGAGMTKKGSETIAGRRCTVWETKNDRNATACVTDDGLVLKGESQSPNGGPKSRLIATTVLVGPISPERFNVPYGFTRFDIPNIPGMGGGGIPGMPSMPSMPSGIQIPGGFTIPRP